MVPNGDPREGFFYPILTLIIRASTRLNLSSGFLTKRVSNQSPQLQRLVRKIEISLVASLDMVLSNERITKALIRLRGCAGWSAALLFANTEDRFSRVEAHKFL